MPIQTREETRIGVRWPPDADFTSRPSPRGPGLLILLFASQAYSTLSTLGPSGLRLSGRSVLASAGRQQTGAYEGQER